MLATDLDGTLVGDKAGLRELLDFYEEQPYEVGLIYITGRHLASAQTLINDEQLPIPKALITDVGTEIYMGAGFEKDGNWEALLMRNWMPARVEAIAKGITGIHKQDLPVDSRRSYHVTDPQAVEQFRSLLQQHAVPHKLIFSGGKDLDILPPQSGKGQALQYLLERYEISGAKLLVAGDSGNDLEMLTLGFPSVIVGNAQPELQQHRQHPLIYRANRHCAGGIYEAWTHFHAD
ncbi:HAD-IIB family hydrolase [Planococcus sp. ISL-109]|nr:HAD-IIB family hydrolase [Planococcus sp. ISL-109]MBT2582902.1 HAD-IIB family hydrolase [Planococcus sp. ISL-109]